MNLYDKSSLILVPSGVKASKVYSQRPENGSGDFTFSRASVANRINENGVLEQVASNVPRLDYSDSSCPSLLLEPQRTNEVFYSQNINNNGLAKIGTSIIIENIISPAGLTSVSLLKENGANNSHFAYKDWALTNPATYTISIFAKSKGENRNLKLNDGGPHGWSSGFSADFNLTSGTASGGTIEDYGNGWYRCSVQGTTSAAASRLIIYSTLGTATTYQGDNVSGVYLYGFQIEQGRYPTSLIDTNGPIVTRNVDTYNNTTGIAGLLGSTTGTFFVDMERFNTEDRDATGGTFELRSSNGQTELNIDIEASGTTRAFYRDGGSFNFMYQSSILRGKFCFIYNGSNLKLYHNGLNQFSSATALSANDFSQLVYTGIDGAKLHHQIMLFPTALTDEEAIALTTL